MIILVPSCKAYSDAWGPFITLLLKYWPDRKYNAVLLSEPHEAPEGFDGHLQQPDLGWSGNIKRALRFFESEDLFLILQEDFFITGPVDADFIETAISIMRQNVFGYFRLYPCPGGDQWWSTEYGIGFIDQYAPYKISCQATIWRRSYLEQILDRTTSPQSFELEGTQYAHAIPDPVVSVMREKAKWPLHYVCTAIVRGKWIPGAIKACEENGIKIDLTKRGVE